MKKGWQITLRIAVSIIIYLVLSLSCIFLFLRFGMKEVPCEIPAVTNCPIGAECDYCFGPLLQFIPPNFIVFGSSLLVIPGLVILLFNFLIFKKKK